MFFQTRAAPLSQAYHVWVLARGRIARQEVVHCGEPAAAFEHAENSASAARDAGLEDVSVYVLGRDQVFLDATGAKLAIAA